MLMWAAHGFCFYPSPEAPAPRYWDSRMSSKPVEAASPAVPLTIASSSKSEVRRGPVARFLASLGPGLITGASDDDPSGIATYSSAGAAFGYAMLWTSLITFPMMAAIQYICAKIALVSGQGIATVLRRHYSKLLLYPVVIALTIANTINAGVDIGAIAEGVHILCPIPAWLVCIPVSIGLVAIQIWGSYALIARIFKWLTIALFAYIGSAIMAHPDWGKVLYHTFVPTIELNAKFLSMLVAILGTTISPYLFFWQADQEVEEKRALRRTQLWRRKSALDEDLHYAAMDVNVGMLFSNSVMFFIILSTAATLHAAGKTEIATAAEAAQALVPLAGRAAGILMALGLIGSGLLAVPILTASSAYALAEAAHWNTGLNEKPARAREFYAVIAVSTLIGCLINFVGIDPIKALVWTAVINGFLAPPLLVVIMIVSNNPAIMGKHVNSPWMNFLGWATTLVMFAAAVGLVWTWSA